LIRVQSHIDSPRLRYVLDFLSAYYAEPFALSSDASAGADIHYGERAVGTSLQVRPSSLLSETGIRAFEPSCAQHPAGFTVLFPDDGPLGFDLFAAIFYLLSRYEEYGPHAKDEYGRYAHSNSIAFRHQFLNRPLVHEWLAHFSELVFAEKRRAPFRFHPTYDIDMAWSYRHKGFRRNVGGWLRALVQKGASAGERLQVLLGRKPDPFDSFAFLDNCHEKLKLKASYFIHAGFRRSRYDKNIPSTHPAMRSLLRSLSSRYEIGLHPSWLSGDFPPLVDIERQLLEGAIGRPVTASRQHYIRFELPHTFRDLIAAGIHDDYSMGYGSINGFRASVAMPFYWYDLEAERQTSLLLHPFCFMDANAYYEQKQDIAGTRRELAHYQDQLRQWGGTLITIWHNSFLGTGAEFAGWRELYEEFLQIVSAGGSPYG
jgi:hypothetical protein